MFNIEGTWRNKIQSANQFYTKWESRYRCKTLEDYYKGFQWKNKMTNINTVNYSPYTINLVYSTIKIKVDSFLFQNPKFLISPRPTTFWNQDAASVGAQVKQDALNAIVSNSDVKFAKRIRRTALDSFFRFGVMEVGYAADWRNPNKVRPLMKSDKDDSISPEADKILDQNELPESERIYIKRIKPSRFRISVTDESELEEVDFFGYFEYYNKRVLQKVKGIDFPSSDKQDSRYFSETFISSVVGDSERFEDKEFLRAVQNEDIVKCWHLWSPVEKKRYFLLDNGCYVLWDGDYERSPILTLRWDDSLDNWYPIPPVFQWLSPQDEINEAREQTRSFRRRFTRKFQVLQDRIEEEEKEKFTSGPDGILITVKQQDAISPIQNPEQGPTAENALLVAKDDFNVITGTSAEVRGESDRETATQARLNDQRTQIRESAEQMDFSMFICEVGREVLLTASEKLTQSLWVKYTNTESDDPSAWQLVNSDKLSDGYDFDITVDITNATPAAMAQEMQSFMQFLAIVSQYPLVQLNPALIREAAYRCGYRNEKIIQQMQQAAVHQLQLQALQQQQQNQNPQAQGGGINEAKQTLAAQSSSPSPDKVNKQITNQIQ